MSSRQDANSSTAWTCTTAKPDRVQGTNPGHNDQLREELLGAVSCWLDNEHVIPTTWKEVTSLFTSDSVATDIPNPGLRNHAQNIAWRLRRFSDTLLELASALKEEHDVFQCINRKWGLALLPDEILAKIFKFIIDDITCKTENSYHLFPHTWEAAMRLSHVCQRFRNVVLACPQFWTTMYQCSIRGSTIRALPRTKNLPLSVDSLLFRRKDEMGWTIEQVIEDLLPHTQRWGRLGLIFTDNFSLNTPTKESVIQNLRQLDAPLLEGLHVKGDFHDIAHRFSWDWSQWNTPKLRRIHAINYFPYTLPQLANITSLDLTLDINNETPHEILKKVSELSHLQDFSMELVNCLDGDYVHLVVLYEQLDFSQVRRLEIRSQPHFEDDDCSPAIKRALFSSLFFSSLTHLHLKLSGYDYSQDDLEDEDGYTLDYNFSKEIGRIFRHVEQFPKVETFHLKIHSPLGDHHNSEFVTKLSIPLNMLPKVKHFTLTSNTRLDVEDPEDPDEIVFWEEQELAPRVEGNTLPVLETITLDMPDASVVAVWLREYLEKLKERGELKGFHELIILRDDEAGIDCHTKLSYTGEEALDWCNHKSTC